MMSGTGRPKSKRKHDETSTGGSAKQAAKKRQKSPAKESVDGADRPLPSPSSPSLHLFCRQCKTDLDNEARHRARPCNCLLCPTCFGEWHGERVVKPLPCPGCARDDITGHLTIQYRRQQCAGEERGVMRRKREVSEVVYQQSQLGDGWDELEDYLRADNKGGQSETIVLAALSLEEIKDGQSSLVAATCSINKDEAENGRLSEESVYDLLEHAGIIGSILTVAEKDLADPASFYQNAADDQKDVIKISEADRSVLKLFIFALMTCNRPDRDPSKDEWGHAAFVIAELIRYAVSGKPGPFIRTAAIMAGCPQSVLKTFMSKFKIGLNRANVRLDEIKYADEQFAKGIAFERHMQAAVSSDNLDVTIGGNNCRMYHTTSRQLMIKKKAQLTKGGFYAATSSAGNTSDIINPYDRTRRKWRGKNGVRRAVINQGGGKSLLPKESHYEPVFNLKYKLLHRFLEHWDKLPDIEQMCAAADAGDFASFNDVSIGSFGATRVLPCNDSVLEMSKYEIADTVLDHTIPLNLSTNECVQELMDYCLRILSNIANAKAEGGENIAGTVMEKGYIYLLLDGKPAVQAYEIQKRHHPKYALIRVIAGGLHHELNFHKARGNIHGKLRYKAILRRYLNSDQKVMFNLNPGDPNQPNEAMIGHALAHLFMQAVGYARTLKVGRADHVNISPVDIHDWVLELSKHEHTTILAENDLNWSLIGMLLIETENGGNGEGQYDLFEKINRILMLLWPLDHKLGYQRIGQEYVKMELTNSEMDSAMIQKNIWTKPTVHEGAVFSDKWQEWQQRDMSSNGGLDRTCGHDFTARLDRLSLNLSKKEATRNAATRRRKSNSTAERRRTINATKRSDRPYPVGRAFLSEVSTLHKMNTYLTRNPDGCTCVLPSKDEEYSDEPLGMREPTGKEGISDDALFMVSEGKDRATKLYDYSLLEVEDAEPPNTNKLELVVTSREVRKERFLACFTSKSVRQLKNKSICALSSRKSPNTLVFAREEYDWTRDKILNGKKRRSEPEFTAKEKKKYPKREGNKESLEWLLKRIVEGRELISEKRKKIWKARKKEKEEQFEKDNVVKRGTQRKVEKEIADLFYTGPPRPRNMYKRMKVSISANDLPIWSSRDMRRGEALASTAGSSAGSSAAAAAGTSVESPERKRYQPTGWSQPTPEQSSKRQRTD